MKNYEKFYPCIGGPLDGQVVQRSEFLASRPPSSWEPDGYAGGVNQEYRDVYFEFNRAHRSSKTPAVIWIWKGLLP